MKVSQLMVDRLIVTSSRPFETVVACFERMIGHPDMSEFQSAIGAAKTYAEMEAVIQKELGKSGFLELGRFDLGAILRKEMAQTKPKSLRFLIGNPLIMKEMLKHVLDAGSYAPVTILIDERPDGVHLSYGRMASLLAPYGNADALKVARDLDSKVENLLVEAAESA